MGHEGAPGVFPEQWETSLGAEGQVGKDGRKQGRADVRGWVGVSIIYNLQVNKVNGQKHVRFCFFFLATLHDTWDPGSLTRDRTCASMVLTTGPPGKSQFGFLTNFGFLTSHELLYKPNTWPLPTTPPESSRGQLFLLYPSSTPAQNPLPKFTTCTSTPGLSCPPGGLQCLILSMSSPPSYSLPKPWCKRSSANNSNSSLLAET